MLHLLLFLQNSVCHTLAREYSVAPASFSTKLGLSHSGSGRQCCTCFCFYRTQFVTLWLRKTVLHLLLFLQNSVCHTLAQEDSVAPAELFLHDSVCHTLAQEYSVAPASVSTELSLLRLGKTVLHLFLFLQNSVCRTLAQEDSVAPASVSTELSLSHSGSGRQCCTCFCLVIYTTHHLHHQHVAMSVRIIIIKTSSTFLRTLYLIAQSSIRPGLSTSSLVN